MGKDLHWPLNLSINCSTHDESHCEKSSQRFHDYIIELFARFCHIVKHPFDKPTSTPAVSYLTIMSACRSVAQLIAKESLQAICGALDSHPLTVPDARLFPSNPPTLQKQLCNDRLPLSKHIPAEGRERKPCVPRRSPCNKAMN